MKICLGSAQFGLNYGLTNKNVKVNKNQVFNLLDFAIENGITLIDTSPSYGNAEITLGKYPQIKKFNICTKIDPIEGDSITNCKLKKITSKVTSSLKTLNSNSFDTLLTHGPTDFLKKGNAELFSTLKNLKSNGLVKNIGASVYNVTQIESIIDQFEVDVLQVPISIFDQRLLNIGILQKVIDKGIKIQARSIFLQGLVLENPSNLGKFFNPIKANIKKFQDTCSKENLTPLVACINFIKAISHIDTAIVGVTSLAQLEGILKANHREINNFDWSSFKIDQEEFLNPTNWPVPS